MTKERALKRIAGEIARCRSCKQGCSGEAVPGEGDADARVMFIGEAPGREEAKTGRPFVGRSGKLLRQTIREIGLAEEEVFITSRCTIFQTKARVEGDDPPRQGASLRTACHHRAGHHCAAGEYRLRALLDTKVEITKKHGTIVRKDDRTFFITVHPPMPSASPREGTAPPRLCRLKRLIKAPR